MSYKVIQCEVCGAGELREENGKYRCPYCGHAFREQTMATQDEKLKQILGEVNGAEQLKSISNIRRNLWNAVSRQNVDGDEVLRWSRELKKYLPDDFMANFYEVATNGTVAEINKFLNGIDVNKTEKCYIEDILNYLTRPLAAENLASIRYLIERAFTDDAEKREKYNSLCDDDEEAIQSGVYDETLPRDVFIAYKSEDMDAVNELCEFLEKQGLKCFISSRNLKHGRNAVNKYEERLYRAIDHCKVLVFVSTHRSRTMGDARNLELPYIEKTDKANAPAEFRHNYRSMPKKYKMPRVEYLVEQYESGSVNEDFVREFFKGYQYRESLEAVYRAVDEYLREMPEDDNSSDVKYCLACGAQNAVRVRYCSECGGTQFAATQKEYMDSVLEIKKRELEEQYTQGKKRAEEQLAAERAEKEALAREKQEAEERLSKQSSESKNVISNAQSTHGGATHGAADRNRNAGQNSGDARMSTAQLIAESAGQTRKKAKVKPFAVAVIVCAVLVVAVAAVAVVALIL